MPKIDQLLSTKFYIPPVRPELIRRSRLIQQLNDGLRRKLTLISAPAGFGKTTLVNEWVDSLRHDDTGLGLNIEKAIPLDKLNEDLYCLAMRAYGEVNDRTNLSRIYAGLKLVLRNELESDPMPETTHLYNELVGS